MRHQMFCSPTVQDESAQTLSGPIAKLVEATLNNIPDTPKMQKVCIGTLRVLSPGHLRAHTKAAVYYATRF